MTATGLKIWVHLQQYCFWLGAEMRHVSELLCAAKTLCRAGRLGQQVGWIFLPIKIALNRSCDLWRRRKLPKLCALCYRQHIFLLLRHLQSIQFFVKLIGGFAVKFWLISFFLLPRLDFRELRKFISVRQQSDDGEADYGRYWSWSHQLSSSMILQKGNNVHLLYRAT